MALSTIDVIVNKSWEVEPLLEAFKTWAARHDTPRFPKPSKVSVPDRSGRMSETRAEYRLSNYYVLVRCVEDMMPPTHDNVPETSGSHSQYKGMLLPGYVRLDKPSLVISVSTAESTPTIEKDSSQNGSVVFGGKFFMYDARDFDRTSPSELVPKEYSENPAPDKVFRYVNEKFEKIVVPHFRKLEHSPAPTMRCLANPNYISVGVVNIVDYEAYEKADPTAYDACVAKCGEDFPATIETTHGIVNMAAVANKVPIVFVSPITDRYQHFAADVDAEQNKRAAYNAGIAVAELLIRIDGDIAI